MRNIDLCVAENTKDKMTSRSNLSWTSDSSEPGIEKSFPSGIIHVILPAYNEGKSLPHLLGRMATLGSEQKKRTVVWVVNDGSSDDTASIARQGVPGIDVRLVSHERNLGLGQALLTGILSALQVAVDEDIVVVMDADDTHDTQLVDSMAKKIEKGADVVIASRFVPGGDDSTAPAYRRLISRGAAFVFRIFLPIREVKDFTSGYRAYRVDLLRRAVRHWGERLIEEQGFACMVELLLKLRYLDPAIDEVPFVLRYDRKQGRSKLKLGRTIFQYLKLALRDHLAPPPYRMV
jgi:dolichol-phosphate mannosyltransferase